MQKISALELAYYILQKFDLGTISPMKLQKLAFYCKVWLLVSGAKCMVDAPFYKWTYGPVNKDIFKEFKGFSKSGITAFSLEKVPALDPPISGIINLVLDSYGDYTATQLSNMTHEEDPWIYTEEDSEITDNVVVEYYSKQVFAKNFSLENADFHVVEDDAWHAFVLDMDHEEAQLFQSFDSLDDFKKKFGAASTASSALLNAISSKYVS